MILGCLQHYSLADSDNELWCSLYSLNTIIQDYNIQICTKNLMKDQP